MRLAVISLLGLFTIASGADQWELFSTSSDSKIHFRSGIVVRSIGADFKFGKVSGISTFPQGMVRRGLGDVGFFEGGNGTVTYEDGTAGPDPFDLGPGIPTGLARFTVDGADQFKATGRTELALPVYEVSFHSSDYEYSSTLDNLSGSTAGSISDDDTEVGPFIELVVPIREKLNFVVGYSYLDTEHSTGNRLGAIQHVYENATNYEYTYDGIGGVSPGTATYPYDSTVDGGILVYDVTVASTAPGTDIGGDELLDPRRSVSTSSTKMDLYAICSADLNVKLHEIPFGLERTCQVGRTTLACTGGLTMNIIDFDLESRVDWYSQGSSTPFLSNSYRNAGHDLKWGAYLGINAHCPLNEEDTVYFDSQISYRWVDSTTVTAGKTSVEIDPSSWEARFGIGILIE